MKCESPKSFCRKTYTLPEIFVPRINLDPFYNFLKKGFKK